MDGIRIGWDNCWREYLLDGMTLEGQTIGGGTLAEENYWGILADGNYKVFGKDLFLFNC